MASIITTPAPLYLTTPGLNVVRSRIRDGSEWSAITTANFLVDTDPASVANLVISEIHYRAGAPTAAELQAGFSQRSDFDFIELTNTSDRHIDLAGIAFTTGIDFVYDVDNPLRVLAPGGRVLLAKNRAGFEFRYGTGLPIAGEYSGDLSNDGEQLVLIDPAQATLIDLTYNDAGTWPESADGTGYSLVLIDPSDPGDPANWRSSSAVHGNPGTSDAVDFESWMQVHGITDDQSDDDSDGLTALLEYAFGGDPHAPSCHLLATGSLASLEVDMVTDNYLVVSTRRRIGADDIRVIAESSGDLASWFPEPVYLGPINNGDGTETLRFRSAEPAAAGVNEFVRARITLIPRDP